MTSGKHIPVRQCAGCRQKKERGELFRIVWSGEDLVFLDRTGKAQGRGAYLCRSEECLRLAAKKRSLERSFQRAIPKERLGTLYEEMRQELAKSKLAQAESEAPGSGRQ